MVSSRARWCGAFCFGLLAIAQVHAHAASGGDVAVGQVMAKGSDLADKDLAPAVQKLRQGRNDEALGLLREMVAKHPDWPPAPLIMARLLIVSGQAASGRRALERAAAETPHHPAIYLAFGALALAEGRYSDARLNFEAASAEIKAGKWDAEQAQDLPHRDAGRAGRGGRGPRRLGRRAGLPERLARAPAEKWSGPATAGRSLVPAGQAG